MASAPRQQRKRIKVYGANAWSRDCADEDGARSVVMSMLPPRILWQLDNASIRATNSRSAADTWRNYTNNCTLQALAARSVGENIRRLQDPGMIPMTLWAKIVYEALMSARITGDQDILQHITELEDKRAHLRGRMTAVLIANAAASAAARMVHSLQDIDQELGDYDCLISPVLRIDWMQEWRYDSYCPWQTPGDIRDQLRF